MTGERWHKLLASLSLAPEEETWQALIDAYSEKHRHYHTVQHIEHCLRELDSVTGLAVEPGEVEMALWFHDAVYDPYSSSNEEKSAAWACDFMRRAGCEPARVDRINAHILATRHNAAPADSDSQLVVDIDLSILGADQPEYDAFERNVREEYRWVPSLIFRKKRAQILQSFLDRPYVYHTAAFQERYEKRARSNLSTAIAALLA